MYLLGYIRRPVYRYRILRLGTLYISYALTVRYLCCTGAGNESDNMQIFPVVAGNMHIFPSAASPHVDISRPFAKTAKSGRRKRGWGEGESTKS
jgi:hypothetical protein